MYQYSIQAALFSIMKFGVYSVSVLNPKGLYLSVNQTPICNLRSCYKFVLVLTFASVLRGRHSFLVN